MGKLITGKLGNDHVNSEDIGLFQACIGGEGTYVMMGCDCTMSSANNLHISKGALLVQGRFYVVDAAGEDIAIKNGSQGVKRNDLVVLRYTKDSSNQNIENMEFVVVDGVPVAGDPVDPEIAGGDILANDSSIVEIAFCRIQLDGISVGDPVMLFDSLPPLHQAWDSISPVVLFDNDASSMSGDTSLSESAANFKRLTICFRNNNNAYASVDVLNPNGKLVNLQCSSTDGETVYLKIKTVQIDGSNINTYRPGSRYWTGETGVRDNYTKYTYGDYVAITQVLGWR